MLQTSAPSGGLTASHEPSRSLTSSPASSARLPRDRRIVQQAQHAVAELHLVVEPAVRQLERARHRAQHPRAHGVERLEQAGHVRAEARNVFVRPQIGQHVALVRMAVRQVATGVPELLQVVVLAALGGLDAEGRVAARAAAARHMPLALHLVRQGEERLGRAQRPVDHRLVQAVVADHREAVPAKRRAEVMGEAVEVPVAPGIRHRLDPAHVPPSSSTVVSAGRMAISRRSASRTSGTTSRVNGR